MSHRLPLPGKSAIYRRQNSSPVHTQHRLEHAYISVRRRYTTLCSRPGARSGQSKRQQFQCGDRPDSILAISDSGSQLEQRYWEFEESDRQCIEFANEFGYNLGSARYVGVQHRVRDIFGAHWLTSAAVLPHKADLQSVY